MTHPDANLIQAATLTFTALLVVVAILLIPWKEKDRS